MLLFSMESFSFDYKDRYLELQINFNIDKLLEYTEGQDIKNNKLNQEYEKGNLIYKRRMINFLEFVINKPKIYFPKIWKRNKGKIFDKFSKLVINFMHSCDNTKKNLLDPAMFVLPEDVEQENYIIYILVDKAYELFINSPSLSVYLFFQQWLTHEAVHLIQYQKKIYSKMLNSIKKIESHHVHNIEDDSDHLQNHWTIVRKLIMKFFYDLKFEGEAEFYRRFGNSKFKYNKIYYYVQYILAYKQIEILHNKFYEHVTKISNMKQTGEGITNYHRYIFGPKVTDFAYQIGYHIIFTLSYANYKIKDIHNMEISKLIKIYEKIMEQMAHKYPKKNIIPLISLNSEKGIFDYGKAINDLYAAFSKDTSNQEL
jgi:hypothetical protein